MTPGPGRGRRAAHGHPKRAGRLARRRAGGLSSPGGARRAAAPARGLGARLLGAVLAVASLTAASPPCFADERILDFASDIAIAADGSMTVTETIRVRAEGNEIVRGIYRDFPTRYRDRLGNDYRVDFAVLTVRRDGAGEPFFTERRSNGVRVYVGQRARLLEPGEHEYELRYLTDHQIGFFAGHDELYWNVTGNGWDFPVDAAAARVTLPTAVAASELTMEGYVGRTGSTEQSVRVEIEGAGAARITATRGLAPREGLTLVMTWPKGVIPEPTAAERAARFLGDNVGVLIALAGLLVTIVYFIAVWRAYGRDPEPGVIFPRYEPPDLVSPASARYVRRMGYDRKSFSAAIVNLAVKGYLEIEEEDGEYTLRPTAAAATRARARAAAPLAPGERALLEQLFGANVPVKLENSNHRTLRAAMRAHGNALKRNNYRIYFVTNSIYLVPAIAIIAGVGLAILILEAFTPFATAVLVATALLVPAFAYLLKAPTRIGRRLLDEIEGFRLYLDVAEKDELELKHPPEKTPELFEAYLPYAFALGVEQRWAERFDDVFARMKGETGHAYRPAWYRGHWDTRHPGGAMVARMSGALGSAIASAATPPGSSSGSGGGGFSGGGGGGGGGGGW